MTSTRRSNHRVRLGGLLLIGALMVAACAEGTVDELVERYGESDQVRRLPTPDRRLPDAAADDDDDRTPLQDGDIALSITPDGVVSAATIDCPFETADLGPVTCGEVIVPNRGEGNDDVTLTFAWFESTGPADGRRPDPVIYLHGGPGGAVVEFADLFVSSVVDPFIAHRDVILYDQRGGGLSSPLPLCTGAWELDHDYYADSISHAVLAPRYADRIAECGRTLNRRRSIDLRTYRSAVHADDLVDLRTALGIGPYNLYGSSYGSRLAQTVMRDHPDDVRSVILSGVYPIEVNLLGSTPETFRAALDNVFAACADDADCHAALPEPWAAYRWQVERLDADPVLTKVAVAFDNAFTSQIAGDDLVNAFHGALYRADSAAMLPDVLIDLEDGDTSRLERLANESITDIAAVAPYVAVQCHEEVPFTTIAEIDADHTGVDAVDRVDLPPGLLGSELVDLCPAWDLGPADPTENEPVSWDQPTLLFSGGFDPITPPGWVDALAARLPHVRTVHSAARGHDSDEGYCAQGIMSDFIENPGLAFTTTCLAYSTQLELDHGALRWNSETAPTLVRSAVDLSLDDDFTEIDTPDWAITWNDDAQIFWRDLDVLDLTSIIVEPGERRRDAFTEYLDTEVSRRSPVETPALRDGWNRFELVTAGMDLVIHERTEPTELMVALVAYDDDLAALERNVVVPMLESIDGA